jgi:hypothetical protein
LFQGSIAELTKSKQSRMHAESNLMSTALSLSSFSWQFTEFVYIAILGGDKSVAYSVISCI